MRHYLQFKDFRAEEYAHLFERAASIKRRFKNYERYQPLADRTLAMIFEKASTRTRVSFEAGVFRAPRDDARRSLDRQARPHLPPS